MRLISAALGLSFLQMMPRLAKDKLLLWLNKVMTAPSLSATFLLAARHSDVVQEEEVTFKASMLNLIAAAVAAALKFGKTRVLSSG